MTAIGREQFSVRTLLESLKKSVPFTSGLLISVVPRGGLQIAQPANVADPVLKGYARGFETEDRLSWQAIVKRKPLRPNDVYSRDDFESTPYYLELMLPLGAKFALALPLAAPLLEGYPGVVHVLRTAADGEFSAKEVEALLGVIHQFDAKRQSSRETKGKSNSSPLRTAGDVPAVSFAILDVKLKPIFNGPALNALDGRLREQLLDHAKKRLHQSGGQGATPERVQLPDSHGDVWVFSLSAHKHFPALGDGAYALICRQPGCNDWGAIKPQDFQADDELSRLIPAVKYMQQEFTKGPKLPDIARQVHLSPFHFHRRFTELLGLTPKQFLLDCQIHVAKTELMARDKDLAQIAKDCGFAHQSHFTSRFKQTTGLTPTRWRRMVKERQEAE